ncbi:hypothetical protein ISCGN_014792 [Ixodes scapularis]
MLREGGDNPGQLFQEDPEFRVAALRAGGQVIFLGRQRAGESRELAPALGAVPLRENAVVSPKSTLPLRKSAWFVSPQCAGEFPPVRRSGGGDGAARCPVVGGGSLARQPNIWQPRRLPLVRFFPARLVGARGGLLLLCLSPRGSVQRTGVCRCSAAARGVQPGKVIVQLQHRVGLTASRIPLCGVPSPPAGAPRPVEPAGLPPRFGGPRPLPGSLIGDAAPIESIMVAVAVWAPCCVPAADVLGVGAAAVRAPVLLSAGSSGVSQSAASAALDGAGMRRRDGEAKTPEIDVVRAGAVEVESDGAPPRKDVGALDWDSRGYTFDHLGRLRLETGADNTSALGRRFAQVATGGSGACGARRGSPGAGRERLLLSGPRPPSWTSCCLARAVASSGSLLGSPRLRLPLPL